MLSYSRVPCDNIVMTEEMRNRTLHRVEYQLALSNLSPSRRAMISSLIHQHIQASNPPVIPPLEAVGNLTMPEGILYSHAHLFA
jgi:hypothetical protein